MSKKQTTPSLLPFLSSNKKRTGSEKHGRVRLVIRAGEREPSGLEGSPQARSAGYPDRFPFPVASQSDSLSRVIEAGLYTDAGSRVKSLFLLVQKDEYAILSDDLWPVSNTDTDKCWRRAFESSSGKQPGAGNAMIFEEQAGPNGEFLPYLPVFFCKTANLFFHPPCPECGDCLDLCRDDDLLEKNGLHPYSTTLERYLYCPSCAENKGEPNFFVKSLKGTEPPIVTDMGGLVSEFKKLFAGGKKPSLPCGDCEHLQACFGEELAASRIVPFSFYPFYMLAFESASLNSQDFLALLSGASFEELDARLQAGGQTGRRRVLQDFMDRFPVKKPFLFHDDRRFFPEVLFLKLAFLGELAQAVFPRLDIFQYPDLSISMDRIWLKLDQKSGRLPLFWNFRVLLMDIGGKIPEMSFLPKLPPHFGLHFLGTIWFFTLLSNKSQGVREIYGKIADDLKSLADDKESNFKSVYESVSETVFAPKNIFWSREAFGPKNSDAWVPGDERLSEKCRQLWYKALSMGWELLENGIREKNDWTRETFFNRLESLTDEVHSVLMAGQKPADSVPEPAVEDSDLKIHAILEEIAQKWENRVETSKALSKATEEKSVEGTIILSDEDAEEEPGISLEPEPDKAHGISEAFEREPKAEKMDMGETVVLSGKEIPEEPDISEPEWDRTARMPAARGQEREDGDDDILETAVLSMDDFQKEAKIPEEKSLFPEEPDEDEDADAVSETVILGSGEFGKKTGLGNRESLERVEDPGTDLDGTFRVESEREPEREMELEQEWDEDDEDEDSISTVLLKPGELARKIEEEAGKAGGKSDDTARPAPAVEDYRRDRVEEEEDEDEDDFLVETVFLSDGKPDGPGPDSTVRRENIEDLEEKERREKDRAGADASRKDTGSGDDGDDGEDDLPGTIIVDPDKF